MKSVWFVVPVFAQDVFLRTALQTRQHKIAKHFQTMLEMRGHPENDAFKFAEIMASREHLISEPDNANLVFNEHPPYQSTDKWIVNKGEVFTNDDGVVVETQQFTSPVIKLKSGEAHFTINDLYHMPMPKGDYFLLKNHFDMVNDDGSAKVTLNEVYPHHWLVGGDGPLTECDHDYFWGGGAEFHGMNYNIPDGYGFPRISSKGWCGANVHIIDTNNLTLQWEGLNDPSQFPNPQGAAVKNCIECGWAPGRAIECTKGGDGTFACCFTKSRCPTEGRKLTDKARGYRFQYEIQLTRNMSAFKPLKLVLLDAGAVTEWNIAPNHVSEKEHTSCDDVICKTERTWTVGHWNANFGSGLCPGNMLWAYLHQHVGAINGSFSVNGKQHCAGYPTIGKNMSNPYGDEAGYVQAFDECISPKFGNGVRLNTGDNVTVTSYYDVDVNSTLNYPLPGGKHGGVMALYFAAMECDPGTFGEVYICRDSACVPTYDGKTSGEPTYSTIGDCQSACA